MTTKMIKLMMVTMMMMMMMVCIVKGQLSPPPRQVGYAIGEPTAPIMLEMFADLQCPYCGDAYPKILQVLDYFGPDQIYFVLHIYPLWLHRQAYDAAKALATINQIQPTQTQAAISYFFKNQEDFFNAAFANQTELQLIDLFASYASQFGIDKPTFLSVYNSSSASTYVSYDLHYGISHQVPGTPTFWVNGFVNTTLGDSTPYDEWISYLSGLISAGKQ
eukprot:TRINITY_DN619_c1_g1_i3.p1 TRINITY_DN619_c1_g1~~TRINITY_DN619_c1_g1_i3.p1  ORF type:complete len:219 (-),score=59.57 TRINITY_DN619_c1_g1_i3:44-700(-)